MLSDAFMEDADASSSIEINNDTFGTFGWDWAGRASSLIRGPILAAAPFCICSNFLILAALHRFKRLRTASNYFIGSLASSDMGIGFFFPLVIYFRESDQKTANFNYFLCFVPASITISFSIASVLVMAAMAYDRFTSLSHPLQYNNLITRTSVQWCIVAFWTYAFVVGFVPLLWKVVYTSGTDAEKWPVGGCDFDALLDANARIFLLCAVFVPCSIAISICYGYIYVIARYHAKAISTVESSLRRHNRSSQSKYGQTLAITVGLFFLVWSPYQLGVIVDTLLSTSIMRNWMTFCLLLPAAASSALNPWIYSYRNSDLRAAAIRIIQDALKYLGYKSGYANPVNVIVASAATGERRVTTRLNRNISYSIRHTALLMASLHESDQTTSLSSATPFTTFKFESTACLTSHYCKNVVMDLREQVTEC